MSPAKLSIVRAIIVAYGAGMAVCFGTQPKAGEHSDQIAGTVAEHVEPSSLASLRKSQKMEGAELLPLNPLSVITLEQLNDTIDRPLFSHNRRPPKVILKKQPPPKKKVKKPLDTKAFSLVGVVSGNGTTIALLRQNSTGAILRVQAGDIVGKWLVQTVESTNVLIVQEETAVTLTLFPQ